MKPTTQYHPFSALLHWLVVGLVLACMISIIVSSCMAPGNPARAVWMNAHLITGQLLFLVNLIRLSFFSAFGTPAPEGMDFHQLHVSRLLHALLYGAVGFLACTGTILAVANAAGQIVFGIHIPLLLTSGALGMVRDMHTIGNMGFILLCIVHVLYTLALHFCFGLPVLQKMRPSSRLFDYLAGPVVDKGFARLDVQTAVRDERH